MDPVVNDMGCYQQLSLPLLAMYSDVSRWYNGGPFQHPGLHTLGLLCTESQWRAFFGLPEIPQAQILHHDSFI